MLVRLVPENGMEDIWAEHPQRVKLIGIKISATSACQTISNPTIIKLCTWSPLKLAAASNQMKMYCYGRSLTIKMAGEAFPASILLSTPYLDTNRYSRWNMTARKRKALPEATGRCDLPQPMQCPGKAHVIWGSQSVKGGQNLTSLTHSALGRLTFIKGHFSFRVVNLL